MGTQSGRDHYEWSRQRYASDLTDAEWAKVGPLIPPAKPGGNKRTVDVREIVNGVMYVLSTGCRWHAIPGDLPARSTVHDYLERWICDGTLERIHHALYAKCRDDTTAHEGSGKARCGSTSLAVKQARRSELRRVACWSAPRPGHGDDQRV